MATMRKGRHEKENRPHGVSVGASRLGATAHANTITGNLAFSGTGPITLTGTANPLNLSNNTGFSFGTGPNAVVYNGTGDFASIVPFSHVMTAKDFSFNPLKNAPGSEFEFTANGKTYDLTMTSVMVDTNPNTSTFAIHGIGTLTDGIPGDTNSNTTWTFTVSQVGGQYQWGGTIGAPAPVPEPATLLLLGSGMIALVLYRSRRKKRT